MHRRRCGWVVACGVCAVVAVCWAQPAAPLDAMVGEPGARAQALIAALDGLPEELQASMRFLLTHMPAVDRRELPIDLLVENVRLAHEAMAAAPWRQDVPPEVFLNDVLPYANINERRERWRKDFRDRFAPLVANARTTSEAAVILNRSVFDVLGVRYSRDRPKPDQSPGESVEAGKASCTGLGVILVDACRAVGVPARLAGVIWEDGSGNHTWVEIYDRGQWRFTGAAEPTGDQLDQGWFTSRAAQAPLDHPRHSIHAVSFRTTDRRYPLPWAEKFETVHAVNVTERYRRGASPTQAASRMTGADALAALEAYLAKPERDGLIEDRPFAHVALSRHEAQAAAHALWNDHAAALRRDRAQELQQRRVTLGPHVMRYELRVLGEKPEGGRPLYISLHGGGEAPPQINEQQWRNQINLYTPDQGVYLAPRAPTNTWDLWHQQHIDPMFDQLITDMIVTQEVDPDRVYLMGYSAGGDGVYQLAPRMADRFAAASMMAGHPNETTPQGLRNLPFSIHVGEHDAAFKRNEVAQQWGQQLAQLRQADPEGYEHWCKLYPGKGHWMDRQDAAALPWMARFTREPMPARIVWKQDNVLSDRFYWLALAAPDRKVGSVVTAQRLGQAITITTEPQLLRLTVRLHDRMLDMDQPVTIDLDGRRVFEGVVPRRIAAVHRTLAERGDPKSIYFGEVCVAAPEAP